MIEIGEREEQALGEERAAAEKATHEALMKEANLDGAEALADVMVSHCSITIGSTPCERLHIFRSLPTSGSHASMPKPILCADRCWTAISTAAKAA